MCGYNNNTLGVCLLGNFEIVSPTSSMLAKLKELLAYKACKESISADGDSDIVSYPGHMHHISGHKDGCSPNYTSCPGIKLYTKLDSMRLETKRKRRAGFRVPPDVPESACPAFTGGGERVSRGVCLRRQISTCLRAQLSQSGRLQFRSSMIGRQACSRVSLRVS